MVNALPDDDTYLGYWGECMRSRRHPRFLPARVTIQLSFLVFVLLLGALFAHWAFAHIEGRTPSIERPPGVEGFLPISALMTLRLWLGGGGIHTVHPAGLAILLAILAMSAVVAKSFCSHLCPVGAVSEWLGRGGRQLLGCTWDLPKWLDIPLRSLKYVLLVFFVWATWVAMDLESVRRFLDSPYNKVADAKMLLFFARPSELTIAVLGVLVVGSVLVRDLWCRYLCPYGALLGLVGKLALFKIARDGIACIDCRKCTQVCPGRLPVHALDRVSSVECTSCQDCVAVCPVRDCLTVQAPRPVAGGRWLRPRVVFAVASGIYLAVVFGFRAAGYWRSSVPETELAQHLGEIDSPLYTHVGGLAASETPPNPPLLAGSHVRD